MQALTELQVMIGMVAGLASLATSCYLIIRWKKYPNRLLTDLPFLFGIVTLLMAGNQIFMNLIAIGYIPDTLEIFRIRALLIGGILLPIVLLILHIWFPRYRKYYPRAILAFAAYWVGASLLAPTREVIMIMDIPLLLTALVVMIATFVITWKTGRLKEIRSDLLILGILLMFISQVTKVWLLSIGLGYIPDMLTSLGTIGIALGVVNPWYREEMAPTKPQTVEVSAV